MSWNSLEDAKMKIQLLDWRLGRIAFHQKCNICGSSLSRKHAVLCSGAEDYLLKEFSNLQVPLVNTVIDSLLNDYYDQMDTSVLEKVYNAIIGIRQSCLLQSI